MLCPAIWTSTLSLRCWPADSARGIGANAKEFDDDAIEVGVHNVTLAIFITLSVLDNLPLAVMQNIYGVVMLLNAGLLIRWFRSRITAEQATGAT